MKPQDDNTLRERAILRAALEGPAPCLTIDDLAAFEQGRLDSGPRDRARNHLAGCARCRTELALFHQFHSAEASAQESADLQWIVNELKPSPAKPLEQKAPWWQWLFSTGGMRNVAWAAACVLVLVSVGLYLRGPQQPPLHLPGDERVILRSGGIRLQSPAGDLTASPRQLAWQAVPGAVRYEVRLLEIDRTEIWKGASTTATLPVSADLAAKIIPRKTLLWQVTAFGPGGRKLADSDIGQFRLLP